MFTKDNFDHTQHLVDLGAPPLASNWEYHFGVKITDYVTPYGKDPEPYYVSVSVAISDNSIDGEYISEVTRKGRTWEVHTLLKECAWGAYRSAYGITHLNLRELANVSNFVEDAD